MGRRNIAANAKCGGAPMSTLLAWRRDGPGRGLMTIVCLVVLADRLPDDGISLAFFVLLIGIGSFANAGPGTNVKQRNEAAAAFVALLTPLCFNHSFVSISLAVFGAAYFAVAIRCSGSRAVERIIRALRLILDTGWRIMPDLYRFGVDLRNKRRILLDGRAFVVWIVPLTLGGLFLSLFAAANPLIADNLSALGPLLSHVLVSPYRVFSWFIMASLVWPFVFFRTHLSQNGGVYIPGLPGSGIWISLFGGPAVLRCLVLFNSLFMVQTCLDLYYFWGPGSLPDGLSYAAYAHRGAYPLIITALLAALFSFLATKPGTEATRSPITQILVLAWILQNLLLVTSSIQRLHLYILAYSLTALRLWAFVWMCLVGVGLISILLRILVRQSDAWLVKINISSLVTVLYLGCFVNIPAVISEYDVKHCLEVSHEGVPLDFEYIQQLGPQAIPALDTYIDQVEPGGHSEQALETRATLVATFNNRPPAWHTWNFWTWRLAVYLRRVDG